MIYSGKRICRYRNYETTSSDRNDINFKSEKDLPEKTSLLRIPLEEVHFWEQYIEGYFPFKDTSPKVEITTKQSYRLIVIEDIKVFDTMMENYYATQKTK